MFQEKKKKSHFYGMLINRYYYYYYYYYSCLKIKLIIKFNVTKLPPRTFSSNPWPIYGHSFSQVKKTVFFFAQSLLKKKIKSIKQNVLRILATTTSLINSIIIHRNGIEKL